MSEQGHTIITRHADKGSWKIDEQELRGKVSEQEANLISGVLQTEFPQLTETPLKLEGLIRSLRLGDKIFDMSEGRQVVVSINSGKDRARLTNELATAQIAQREAQTKEKRIDMLQVDEKALVSLLADTADSTWGPYGEMMKNEGISEAEALVRWLHDMNAEPEKVFVEEHPHEGADRYRKVVQLIREQLHIGKDQQTNQDIPLVILGIGHSGPLSQLRHEDMGEVTQPGEIPQFCEMYKFDNAGSLVGTEHVEM